MKTGAQSDDVIFVPTYKKDEGVLHHVLDSGKKVNIRGVCLCVVMFATGVCVCVCGEFHVLVFDHL